MFFSLAFYLILLLIGLFAFGLIVLGFLTF
ncbi:hypothetical protein N203_05565 [Helicobacter pylori UM084]|nr:hypothetical protein N203_05565 [Helicobacter pylori UM084]